MDPLPSVEDDLGVNESYCDRGERSGTACGIISEPTSRQPLGCTNAQGESRGGARTPMTEPSMCCAVGTESLLRESFTLDEIVDAGTVSGMTCIRVLLFKSYKWIR